MNIDQIASEALKLNPHGKAIALVGKSVGRKALPTISGFLDVGVQSTLRKVRGAHLA